MKKKRVMLRERGVGKEDKISWSQPEVLKAKPTADNRLLMPSDFEEIEAEFDGKGYGVFKPAVGEAVIETLRPIREEASRIIKDKAYLESVYKDGAARASRVANKTLAKVCKKVGFVPLS